jgi:hypothetical protein
LTNNTVNCKEYLFSKPLNYMLPGKIHVEFWSCINREIDIRLVYNRHQYHLLSVQDCIEYLTPTFEECLVEARVPSIEPFIEYLKQEPKESKKEDSDDDSDEDSDEDSGEDSGDYLDKGFRKGLRCEIFGFCLLSFPQNKRTYFAQFGNFLRLFEESVFIFKFLNGKIHNYVKQNIILNFII